MRSGIKLAVSTLLLMPWIAVIGCGGSGKPTPPPTPATYTVSGKVTGFSGTGLVLQNNGAGNLTLNANATTFTFAAPVTSGGVYSVTVLTQPAGESCSVANGSGKASANVTDVTVSCTSLYRIGGTLQGLTAPGLVLQDNGGDNLALSADASSFTFATPLAAGSTYSITVLTQPVGENCTVTGGSGTASTDITNASVLCTQLYAVGGVVTGLHANGLELQDNGGDPLKLAAETTSFTFPTALPAGSLYSITVLQQPAGEQCAVINGSGVIATDVANASLICRGEWSWMGGDSSVGLTSGNPGVYGTLGVSNSTNIPGGREQSASWKDAAGNFWLFGGFGYDATGTAGQLNDLWKFDPAKGTSGEWTWMNGNNIAPLGISSGFPHGQPGVYGKLGVPAPGNTPGGREQAVTWVDASGNLWLFGGIGIDSVGMYGFLNDLWEFNPTLGVGGQWAWMGGSETAPPNGQPIGQKGVYGTLGTAGPKNIPGGRYGAFAWVDRAGNFWLYGGNGFDAASNNGYLNDLWEFNPALGTNGEWTWMGGSSTVPPSPAPWIQSALPGVYGKLGTPDPKNSPGGRSSGVAWADADGNLWLFGGLGADSASATGYLNDLWKYTPGANGSAGEWTWMSGSNTIGVNGGQPGVYGLAGIADAANTPGARFSPACWTDASGNLWLMGGQGFDWTGAASGYLNDLWRYTPGADGGLGVWTWMGGSNLIPPSPAFGILTGQPGTYGAQGVSAPANTPGSRIGAAPWTDGTGNLWLFGGQGFDASGAQGYLSDSWKYQP